MATRAHSQLDAQLHATQNDAKFRRRGLMLATSVFACGLFLAGNGASAACVDSANATTCSNGVESGDLIYTQETPVYVAGDFVLTLDNFDVVNGPTQILGGFALQLDPNGFLGTPLNGNGTIVLENDSDVSGRVEQALAVVASGNATININGPTASASSVSPFARFSVGAFAHGVSGGPSGNAFVSTAAGSVVSLDTGFRDTGVDDSRPFTDATIYASAETGTATVHADGTVTGNNKGIVAISEKGNATVIATGSVVGGEFGDAETDVAGIIARVEQRGFLPSISDAERVAILRTGVPGNATVIASGNVTGNSGIIAFTDVGNASVISGAGKIKGNYLGIGAGSKVLGDVSITTGTGDVEATGAANADDEEESYGIGSRVGDSELYAQDIETGGNITVTTGGNVTGKKTGIGLETVNGNITVTTAAGKQTTGTQDNGIGAFVGFEPEIFGPFFDNNSIVPPFLAYGGAGNVNITANGKVSGGYRGINAGTVNGNVIVTSNDVVTGADNDGIKASSGIEGYWFDPEEGSDVHIASGSGDVAVAANADVTGGRHGINAWTVDGNATATVGADAFVTGEDRDGVHVEAGYVDYLLRESGPALVNSGGGGTVTANINGDVDGYEHGVKAWTRQGNVIVAATATSNISSETDNGIQAEAGFHYFESDIGEVLEGGAGNVTVTANGIVDGGSNGISAWTHDGKADVVTGADSDIKGSDGAGVRAEAGSAYFDEANSTFINGGKGDASVIVGGRVAATEVGVEASTTTGNTSVTTNESSFVSSSDDTGLRAEVGFHRYIFELDQFFVGGAGNATVAANGGVFSIRNAAEATTVNGVASTTVGFTGELTSATGNGAAAYAGYTNDDSDTHYFGGGGTAKVDVQGDVKGGLNGIQAWSFDGVASVVTGVDSIVVGQHQHGIDASTGAGDIAQGGGSVAVTADGYVEGKDRGINVWTLNDGPVFVTTGAASEIVGIDGNGIDAGAGDEEAVAGSGGDVTVTANGLVTGGESGITASSNNGEVSVTTGATSIVKGLGAGFAGIAAFSNTGNATVTNSGLAEGGSVGVFIGTNSGDGQRTVINTATGFIRNSSLAFDALAIDMGGDFGGTELNGLVDNQGRIDGRIEANHFGDIVNSGLWNTLGESYGEGGQITNTAAGRIIAAHDAANLAEETKLGVQFGVVNSGLMSLVDASAGSGIKDHDALTIDGDFIGGGIVGLNAYLDTAANSTADHFHVDGDATGKTVLRVVNTNAGGGAFIDEALGDGIVLAVVSGEAAADTFELEGGVISTGLFDYYLVAGTPEDGDGVTAYELFSRPNDGSAGEASQAATGAMGVWNETTGLWEQRQDALRGNVRGGPQITAVSSQGIAENTSPGSVWLEGLVGKVGHDGNSSFNGRVVDTGFDQNIGGLTGGVDFGTELSSGGTVLFGVVGGYTHSDVKFKARTNRMEFDGYSLGAYATFMQDGFFADALVKGEFLNMKHSVGVMSGKSDVTAIGVRADTGYRMQYGAVVFEPLASLSYVNTSVDAYSVGLIDFASSSNDSINAGAGARVAYDTEAFSLSLTGRVWNNFSKGAEVDVSVGGGPSSSSVGAGAFSGTYGELSTRVAASLSEGVTLYGGGALKFDSKTSAKSLFGGLNVKF